MTSIPCANIPPRDFLETSTDVSNGFLQGVDIVIKTDLKMLAKLNIDFRKRLQALKCQVYPLQTVFFELLIIKDPNEHLYESQLTSFLSKITSKKTFGSHINL